MKIRLLILLNKLITSIAKLFGKNGSVLAGSLLFRRDINALNKLIYPKYVIGVTGSSGKGSTTHTLAKILKNNGLKVIYNESGSNAVRGIYTKVMNSASIITKKINADVLLLEIDERHISLAFPKPIFTHLIITNITRDQPTRNTHVDHIFNVIMNSINKNVHLIINADDPVVNQVITTHKGLVSTYGIEKNKYSLLENNNKSLDHSYCPICHTKLNYSYYHYGHLGSYQCSNKCFGRNQINYTGSEINLDEQTMKINNNLIHMDKNVFFAAYYSLAAYALANIIGISEEKIVDYYNTNKTKFEKMKSMTYKDRPIYVIESKNENNLSYLQSLIQIKNDPIIKSVIIGFDSVSTRYPTNDLSWLWDIEFEILQDSKIDKIICLGKFRYDLANRLKYAGIKDNQLVIIDEINDFLPELKNSKGHIYAMIYFQMANMIENLIKEDKND